MREHQLKWRLCHMIVDGGGAALTRTRTETSGKAASSAGRGSGAADPPPNAALAAAANRPLDRCVGSGTLIRRRCGWRKAEQAPRLRYILVTRDMSAWRSKVTKAASDRLLVFTDRAWPLRSMIFSLMAVRRDSSRFSRPWRPMACALACCSVRSVMRLIRRPRFTKMRSSSASSSATWTSATEPSPVIASKCLRMWSALAKGGTEVRCTL
mmetsp:Transcript_6185/g.25771  ORF Transcript_6185/g.25771 Transcript_6185/m.25771 type:complete len:211 (+) Transcript_6185:2584-3216(+)